MLNRKQFFRIAHWIYAALILLFLLLLPPFWILNHPDSPYRPALFHFMDETCGRAPTNQEASDLYLNAPAAADGNWRVAIYDGHRNQRLFIGIGGDDFLRAARTPRYTHRINAQSSAEAVAYLEKLRAQLGPGNEVVEIAVFDHGKSGKPYLGPTPLDEAFFQEVARFSTHPGSLTLVLYGCSVAEGKEGIDFLKKTSSYNHITVIASRRPTTWSIFRISNLPSTAEKDWVTIHPD